MSEHDGFTEYFPLVICVSQIMSDESNSAPFDPFTAASLGDIDYFFKNGLVTGCNRNNWTPLDYAISKGHFSLARAILKSDLARTITKNPQLHLNLAVQSGEVDLVNILFESELVNRKDERGWTPLFYAVYYGRENCVKFLLSHGADLNIRDSNGQTPHQLAKKLDLDSALPLLDPKTTITKEPNWDSPKVNMSEKQFVPKLRSKHQLDLLGKTYAYSPTKRGKVEDKENSDMSPQVCRTPAKKVAQLSISSTKTTTMRPRSPQVPKIEISEPMLTFEQHLKKLGLKVNGEDTVKEFLKYLNLGKYWPIFRDEEVDFETLLTFEEKNLEEIGIKLYGPRRKILLAIEQCKSSMFNGAGFLTNIM